MIIIKTLELSGVEPAIHGMRNPKNSWHKSDSTFNPQINIGENDLKLMNTLASGGSVHAKYRRMMSVYIDVTAPLYWWKEFDTYKIGTVSNSCSTMHKIHSKEFEISDFSSEHLDSDSLSVLSFIIKLLNNNRDKYNETKNKDYWWQMIQMLPASYNQTRTIMLNYEVLNNIYHSRKDHKLDEWHIFCDWINSLPYSELITQKGEYHD